MSEPPPPQWSPAGQLNGEDRTWVLVAHFGGAAAGFISGGVLGWIPPLIAMLSRGPRSPLVRAHAVDALNFQVLWAVIAVIGYVLGTCGLVFIIGAVLYILTAVAIIMEVVFGIIAGIKASNGEPYRYPGSPSWIK